MFEATGHPRLLYRSLKSGTVFLPRMIAHSCTYPMQLAFVLYRALLILQNLKIYIKHIFFVMKLESISNATYRERFLFKHAIVVWLIFIVQIAKALLIVSYLIISIQWSLIDIQAPIQIQYLLIFIGYRWYL